MSTAGVLIWLVVSVNIGTGGPYAIAKVEPSQEACHAARADYRKLWPNMVTDCVQVHDPRRPPVQFQGIRR